MPVFTTPTYDAQKESRANPSRLAAPNVVSGEVEFAVIPYTLAGTEAVGDIINLGLLPAGVIPLPQLSKVACSQDPGGTLLLDIGTAADPDGFADGLVLSNGGLGEFGSTSPAPAWLAPTPLVPDSGSGNAVVYATIPTSGVASLTATTVLYFTIAYKRGR